MSVQRFDSYGYMPSPEGKNMRYDDHARIVAERVAEVTDALMASKREALAEMEQAHAAALAAARAEGWEEGHLWRTSAQRAFAPRTLTADDPEPAVTSVGLDRDQSVWQRVGSTEHSRWVNPFMGTREWSDVLARGPVRLLHDAAAPRTLTRDGWWPFGSFVDYDFPLEFDGEGEDGLPIWERPDKSRLAPRTLTADDPGYHSQRCLHCDHIRATHTLTAHGCIGHALPGRPGADCPCAEFIHDGEATPQVKPCSTCGEPVAYLTARPGWAGGWLHHPARPLDGHPAAIDGEATT